MPSGRKRTLLPSQTSAAVERRAVAIDSFYNFCYYQERRLQRSVAGRHVDDHIAGDDLTRVYREERFGPSLGEDDLKDGVDVAQRR